MQLVVRRLHHHDEPGGERRAREQRRQRGLVRGELLAAEEQAAHRRAGERELEHHRDRALHVRGAEAVHAPAVDPAGPVVLRGHGVEMAGEQDRRVVAAGQHARVAQVADRHAAALEHLRDVGGRARLVARLGRDVDQLERPRGEPLGEVSHAVAQ